MGKVLVAVFRYRIDHLGRLMVDVVKNFSDHQSYQSFIRNSAACYQFVELYTKQEINQGYIEKLDDEILDYD